MNRLPRLLLVVLPAIVFATPATSTGQPQPALHDSAFARAQAQSPVHWRPWTPATLEQAARQHKPVYVFIASQLSELSRATIRQTLDNARTAAWLNDNFVCIFVDADTQPEIAAYARHFTATVKQLQGSPIHLWLTPELQPYDGANYLPPSEEWGKPGFLKTARGALETWTAQPAHARALAAEAISTMRPFPADDASKIDLKTRLDRAAAAWTASADPLNGGFGTAPKQPEPELIRFLLTRDPPAQAAAFAAARALANGAVRDPSDGGFYRRAVDEAWKEPYRQKTLLDQARIALALLDAADVSRDEHLRAAAFGALDFVLKQLRNPDGSFAAALDATLDETTGPGRRPACVRVGTASIGEQALFIAACQRTGEKRFASIATEFSDRLRAQLTAADFVLAHTPGLPASATAADHAALALAFRSLGDDALADRLLARAHAQFFDAATGTYQASPANLPAGIATRVPASSDPLSAEAIALAAGIGEPASRALRHTLLSSIEYTELPPADVLLALAGKPAPRRSPP